MTIDFHIHAFADKIAERAVAQLEITSGITARTRGTISETITKLTEWKVDLGILMPIATKPSQQALINNWALTVQNEYPSAIRSFGSVHPDSPDALDELARIKNMGLYGIKLHPDYQDFFINEERLYPIYSKCEELDLPILFHAGFDPLSPDTIHAIPKDSADFLDKFPNLTVILAHMGGMHCWDEVLQYLVGRKNLYFDMACVAGDISHEQAHRIIASHGADKILLASDCPWQDTPTTINFLEELELGTFSEDLIKYKNALKILKITELEGLTQ